ncbi:MAG TPA: LysR family transcriptional regulator [Steroidobacteraceae bacterium]|nr:LysR family transcriptional regulator [Steroidobacteraceae bacterium]
MDSELARTFLGVVASGSFVDAANRLHVSQSTVSDRIHRLEQTLGVELFVRNQAGATLTPAGRVFQRYAAQLTRTVELARQELSRASGYRATLTVGGRYALWNGLLLQWLPVYRDRAPDIAVRAMVSVEEHLMDALLDGRANLAVLYAPQARPALSISSLPDEQLVLVSTRRDAAPLPRSDYVYVDFGPEFHAQHGLAFPDFAGPALAMNNASLALQHLLAHGGTGYLPSRLTKSYEQSGHLHRVAGAPEFRQPVYLCYPSHEEADWVLLAVDTIKAVAAGTP